MNRMNQKNHPSAIVFPHLISAFRPRPSRTGSFSPVLPVSAGATPIKGTRQPPRLVTTKSNPYRSPLMIRNIDHADEIFNCHMPPSTCKDVLPDDCGGRGCRFHRSDDAKEKEAIDLAITLGMVCVGCRDSNYFGAAAPYVLMACRERLIGIATTNAFPTMPLWGGLGNEAIIKELLPLTKG
jgi:hypothetical protein